MDVNSLIFVIIAVTLLVVTVWQALRGERSRAQTDLRTGQIAQIAETLVKNQAALSSRLGQLAESHSLSQHQLSERLQMQERVVTRALEERLAEITDRVGATLELAAEKQSGTMHDLRERLAVIDAAQKNITELSAQVVGLQDILSNKQARGAFGEIQLGDLVRSILPPSAYGFQVPIGDGKRVDCLLKLPNPPGPIAVDSKFPLESYHFLRNAADDTARAAARRAFAAAILKHVGDIAAKYIVPGQTADSALMFLPSEAIYAELHANFPDVVEKSYRAKVWIVSPTTLMATLNTVRAVLKDSLMREQAGLIQREVRLLLDDIGRIDDRADKLAKHFEQTADDIKAIRVSTEKVLKRGQRIDELQLGHDAQRLGAAE